MKSKFIILELIVYLALPYIIWTYGRELMGDYYAMLLTTFPAFVYTIVRFIADRQLNITGIFIISSLMLSTIFDLLSGSALQMLWNSVWLSYAFTSIFLLSMLLKKPLALYFAVDFAYLQGYPRENNKMLYFMKGNFKWFQLVTALFVFRGLVMNTLMAWLITKHGVDAFMHLILVRKGLGFAFSALIFAGYVFAGNKAVQYMKNHEIDWPIKDTQKRLESVH